MLADRFRTLVRQLLRSTHEDAMTCADDPREGAFRLMLGNLHVGTLERRDHVWHFAYTDAFRARTDLRAIANFPDVARTYESETLWPFFALRIPNVDSEAVRRVAEHDRVDVTSEVEMLRRFGRKTIANPFALEPA